MLPDGDAKPGGVNRRSVLVSGLVGVGVGATGGYAVANRSPQAVPSAGRLSYGPGPSGDDDTAGLQDAITAMHETRGGILVLPSGSYRVTRPLIVPAGVHIAGSSGFPLSPQAGTALKLDGPQAALWFRGGSNGARDLAVIGGGTGSPAVLVGGTGINDSGADCFFQNVSVTGAASDGWVVQGTQNSIFLSCRVQGSQGAGLVVDYSAGGLLFERFESAANTGNNLHILQSKPAQPRSYAIPADNTFVACIFEQRFAPGPSVTIEQIDATSFVHCAFASRPGHAGNDTSALVEISGGRVEFASPVLYVEGPARAGFGVHGAGKQQRGPVVAVTGLAQIAGGSGAFADVDSEAIMLLDGTVLGLREDTPTVPTALLTTRTPPANVYAQRQGSLSVSRDVTANRYLSTPVSVVASGGPQVIDASAGDRHVIELSGRGVPSLSVVNGVPGQRLTIVFVQGATPAHVVLPSHANGFRWSGGAAPTVSSANGYLAVELMALPGDQWIELSRAGTDVH